MSKKQFRSQASSGRASGFGTGFGASSFGSHASPLSYVFEAPDLSGLADANIVVSFKNLMKRDGTTKAKALEEIQTFITSSNVDIEESLLAAWVKLYPRLSIDNSRRVRQLAHNVQGHIATLCGKRMVKYMSSVAAPWLAGTQDGDRAAAKAAQDALKQTFPTQEKFHNLSRAFQASILEYCQQAILNETVQTLCDERTVSPDDAEATYVRVITTSLAVVANLLAELSGDDLAKNQENYDELFSESKLWDFASHSDPTIRRHTYRLLRTCLSTQKTAIENNLHAISKAFIDKALGSHQSGSSMEYMQSLVDLTSSCPTVWTSAYAGKKPASVRLKTQLKMGSQGAPAEYWLRVWTLFSFLPSESLPKDFMEAKDLLKALHCGVSRREERFNASTAWYTYFKVVDLIEDESRMPSPLSHDEHMILIDDMVLPFVEKYLHPSDETSDFPTTTWTISGAKPAWNVSKVALCRKVPERLCAKWPDYAKLLVEQIKTSLPEQAKDFDRSQTAIASAGERWSLLQTEFLKGDYTMLDDFQRAFTNTAASIIHESLQVLVSRNGKPYGAAAVVDAFLSYSDRYLLGDERIREEASTFLLEEAPKLMLTPSQRQLVSLLYHFSEDDLFEEAWNRVASSVANSPDSPQKVDAFKALLSSLKGTAASKLAAKNADTQHFLQTQYQASIHQQQDWSFLATFLKQHADNVSLQTQDAMIADLITSLSISGRCSAALEGLERITATSQPLVRQYLQKPEGAQLIPSLLLLEESEDEAMSQRAAVLSKILVEDGYQGQSRSLIFQILQRELKNTSSKSLPIHTLVEMGARCIENAEPDSVMQLVPDFAVWQEAILSFWARPIPVSLAITNPLGGAIYAINASASSAPRPVLRDAAGYSQALRFAIFTARLFSQPSLFDALEVGHRAEALFLLSLTTLLANDNISVAGATNLWSVYSAEVETDILDFISQAQGLVTHCLKCYAEKEPSYNFVESVIERWLDQSAGSSTKSFYHATAFSSAHIELKELKGHDTSQAQKYDELVLGFRKSHQVLSLCACGIAFGDVLWNGSMLKRYCSELIAALTDADYGQESVHVLEDLIAFNAISLGYKQNRSNVAVQRVVFVVKHMAHWLRGETVTVAVKTELCKALCAFLPRIQSIYGEHWSEILQSIIGIWTTELVPTESAHVDENRVALVHASLRLYATIRSLVNDENDDILEAMSSTSEAASEGLVRLLEQSQGFPDDVHQPLKITNDLIARAISQMPNIAAKIKDAGALYPLLYTASQSVQKTAFALLHRHIPATQEQISFDAALENKAAQLPEELLSLVLEAPTLDSLADASFQRTIPLDLQGYLFSWSLIFDHFTNSSYKVKSDYIDNLKDGNYLAGLLDLTFDILGHSTGKPVDVSKFDVANYVPDSEESPERDTQWLLAHLYYLALTHLPSLTKAHYLTLSSRQTSLTVETWTAKYMSPLIINAAMSAVATWATTLAKDEPDADALTVKVATRSKEVNVSYVVDEQTMAIVIRLPETYPLTGARVEGVSRVAVDEKRWQSWLRNCQGVITFSNGNLIDGLSAWRKNVSGALKGQTECAICYSIISGDKQLPTKRCGTCKNLFHSSCLYKWFKTSNASSCPLCRNAFNYG